MPAIDPVTPPLHLHVRYDDSVPVLAVPDTLPFAELREWIRSRMPDVLPDIAGRACRLHLGDRQIQLFDVRRLIHMLRDEFKVEVTGLYVRPAEVHRYAERELKLKLFLVEAEDEVGPEPEVAEDETSLPGLSDLLSVLEGGESEEDDAEEIDLPDADTDAEEPEVFEPVAAERREIPLPDLPEEEPEHDPDGGRATLTLRRTLRSGAAIRYDGDVTVFGDVNPGAQVHARGNIVVMGRLRGVVHAGSNGDDSAFILAFELSPTQLRIGKHIAIAAAHARSTDGFTPEVASVHDGAIVLEPYRGRLRR